VQLSHKIALCPSPEQAQYLARAAGAARMVWNWALAEWNRQRAAGQKPRAMALKKQFNALKYTHYPWLAEVHRDSHAQPFAHLGRAWTKFFTDLKAGARAAPECRALRAQLRAQGVKLAYPPTFKKKGRCRDAFYVANDKLRLEGCRVWLPRLGAVGMREELRFAGRVLGATVSCTAGRWFIAVQVEVPEAQFYRSRKAHATVGVDLGLKAAATLCSGEAIAAPRPLKAALRRLRLRARRVSRKLEAAKARAGFEGQALPKGTRLPASNNRRKAARTLARLHARIAHVRADFVHKLTTRLCCENQAVVIEDLNVAGMLANERLARAISDVGFGLFRTQLEYKARRYQSRLVVADRWYPSSRLCSGCGWKNEALTLGTRAWTCAQCGEHHERDHNAALNLKRLATVTALPVASPTGNGGVAPGIAPGAAGKVTPVRHELGVQAGSGQEESGAHTCARF
jgi:putative transposase